MIEIFIVAISDRNKRYQNSMTQLGLQ